MRNTLSLSYPIERGVVTNWDDMEQIWRYMYDQDLRIKSEDRPVLIADATLNPAGNREKMLQVRYKRWPIRAMPLSMLLNTHLIIIKKFCLKQTLLAKILFKGNDGNLPRSWVPCHEPRSPVPVCQWKDHGDRAECGGRGMSRGHCLWRYFIY